MAVIEGGFLTKAKGRVGGFVLAMSAGQQIIREYQPNVANPRTSLQKAQRAKMVLAGKLSQITPDAVIIGMATNKRDRRSEYVRTIIRDARVQEVDGEYSAVLLPGNLVFSKGQQAGNVAVSNVTVGVENVEATVTFSSDVDAVMLVAVQYNASNERYSFINYALGNSSGDGIQVPLATAATGDSVNLYVIPLQRKSTAGGVLSSGVDKTDSSYVGNLGYTSPDVFDHMASEFVGSYNYTPAP